MSTIFHVCVFDLRPFLRRRKLFERRVIYDVKDVFICFGVCVWGFGEDDF